MSIFAYIDAQNLHMGVRGLGWELDYKRFRVYLQEKYNVQVAYLFIGFLPSNRDMYRHLESCGFKLIFKETIRHGQGNIKGNCDAELVLQAMMDLPFYKQAIIVSGDGDFGCLIKYLYTMDKLKLVLVPDEQKYSALLKNTAREKIDFISSLKAKVSKATQIVDTPLSIRKSGTTRDLPLRRTTP